MADWLPELDDDDLATLADALEAWEHKDQAADMFGDVLDAAFTDSALPRVIVEKVATQRAQLRQQREREKAIRKERSVLLRAKLLTLRNRRRVERAIVAVPDPER